MSKVYFISDLHLGHKRILEFAGDHRGGSTVEEHDDWIVKCWNSVVGKRDVVYVLGDVAFNLDGLARCGELRGTKKLVMGNHDTLPISTYMDVGFKILPGITKYKDFWLTHCPIHPEELRGKRNIHGHVHQNSLRDPRYINVSVEPLSGIPAYFCELIGKYN